MRDAGLARGDEGSRPVARGPACGAYRLLAMKILRWELKSYRGVILALILVCVALLVHEIFGANGYLALRRQKKQSQELQQQIEALKEQNQNLEKQIQGLKSDPHAIEKMARDQMHLARPGEIIYTLPEKDKADTPASSAKDTTPK